MQKLSKNTTIKKILQATNLGVHSDEVMMNSNEEGVQKVGKHILIQFIKSKFKISFFQLNYDYINY